MYTMQSIEFDRNNKCFRSICCGRMELKKNLHICVMRYRRINAGSQEEGLRSIHAAGTIHPQFGNFVRIKLKELKMSKQQRTDPFLFVWKGFYDQEKKKTEEGSLTNERVLDSNASVVVQRIKEADPRRFILPEGRTDVFTSRSQSA